MRPSAPVPNRRAETIYFAGPLHAITSAGSESSASPQLYKQLPDFTHAQTYLAL